MLLYPILYMREWLPDTSTQALWQSAFQPFERSGPHTVHVKESGGGRSKGGWDKRIPSGTLDVQLIPGTRDEN